MPTKPTATIARPMQTDVPSDFHPDWLRKVAKTKLASFFGYVVARSVIIVTKKKTRWSTMPFAEVCATRKRTQ